VGQFSPGQVRLYALPGHDAQAPIFNASAILPTLNDEGNQATLSGLTGAVFDSGAPVNLEISNLRTSM